ncbi:uncharacterized protein LOC143426669 [Xylocopa sonorina]|uniref:uncharacterized protein LOC143426669 n=1 Tax=Xylocopa sonorina TaxID=1818115 RepID=UPI00403AD6F7
MLDNSKDIILEINKLNLELKKKLEMVSKWRAECAQLQLEFLKLYIPLCLDICESLKETTNTNDD